MPTEFLDRFGDEIDDRVAEVVDEMLGQQRAPGPGMTARVALAAPVLLLAAVASALLRHDAVAAATIWPSAAVIYLALTLTKPRRH
ncbi:MAG TPA: hypothetical protein VMH35_10990 [Streptosporangiaceae bacterium]|nr:hypothetical protein [Streptosporangiaceae bacterium]